MPVDTQKKKDLTKKYGKTEVDTGSTKLKLV